MSRELSFVFAAGGTGGHIMPALAVAQVLRDKYQARIIFIGLGRDIEKRLIGAAGFPLEVVPSLPILGVGFLGKLKTVLKLPSNLLTARALFRKHQPQVVVGFGGFPAFVPLAAAWTAGLPTVLQEQNAEAGLANKIASIFVSRIYAPPGVSGFWRTGHIRNLFNPVRASFTQVRPWSLPVDREKLTLLVVGGSQGARSLNRALCKIAPLLVQAGYQIVHQTGDAGFEEMRKEYEKLGSTEIQALAFISEIHEFYGQAHIVVARSGAMTVAEIIAAGRPAIFVPLPIARGHQAANVRELVASGSAEVVNESEHLAEDLEKKLLQYAAQPDLLANIAGKLSVLNSSYTQGASEKLAADLVEMATKREYVQP